MFDFFSWTSAVDAFLSLGFVCKRLLWTGVSLVGWLSGAIRYIDNSRVGVVEKLFSLRRSVESGLIALGRQAGHQPDVLRGGLHFMFPFQYQVHSVPLVTIPQGPIGYVFAAAIEQASNVLEGLLALLLSDRIGVDVMPDAPAARPETQALRDSIRARLTSEPALNSAPRSL